MEAKGDIVEGLTYDQVMDYEYLQQCYNEVLRMEPPAANSIMQTVTQDTEIGKKDQKLKIRAGDTFFISFEAIHHDPQQWPQPERFEPERFNTKLKDNQWLLAADGKPRNPLAFTPFMGGKRVCLGKTFAETNIRFTFPLIFHHLDFEFVNPDQQMQEKQPYGVGGQKEI